MRRYAIFLLLIVLRGYAQDVSGQVRFGPPFDFPLVLSGNFGEIRSNHFHGGLDFKSQSVPGKKVLALADGYISGIRVTHGSGYVLEVTYDSGYKTILRHNQAFVSPIAARIEDMQYEKQSWEVTLTPEKDEYRVKAGQHIAWSGNMGYSFGPHLHMDMLEVETEDYIDPLPFFSSRIKDTKAPQTQGFMLFPQKGKGVVNGESAPYTFAPGDKKTIEAWGEIGSSIRAYDYMDDAKNRCGVHTVILTVDGEEVFRSTVDRFSAAEDRMINSWTHGQYMKSFIDPGNTLRMLRAGNDNRGLITIDKEKDYQFLYTLKDAYGNTARQSFTVKGKRQPIEPYAPREKYFLRWDKTNFLKEPGLDLLVRKGELYDNVELNYLAWTDSADISHTYRLHDGRVAFHRGAELQIGLKREPVEDTSKYYIARVGKDGKLSSAGGRYEDGILKTRIRELGTYKAAIDTIPPEITPVRKENWAREGKITYKIKEKETGISSYRGTIDGEYALFGLHIMNDHLVCNLNPKRVRKGETHTIIITVADGCGNETTITDTFKW